MPRDYGKKEKFLADLSNLIEKLDSFVNFSYTKNDQIFVSTRLAERVTNTSPRGPPIRLTIYFLSRWSSSYNPSGRLTWVNIIGVPISCGVESVFKRIVGLHGIIVETENCRLIGNQNFIVGRVHIHSTAKDLVNEPFNLQYRGKSFKVKVIEEIRDITLVDTEKEEQHDPERSDDRKDMDISDTEGSDSEDDSDREATSSDEEEEGECNSRDGDGDEARQADRDGQKVEEDEEFRVSKGTRFNDTFEDEVEVLKISTDVDEVETFRDHIGKENDNYKFDKLDSGINFGPCNEVCLNDKITGANDERKSKHNNGFDSVMSKELEANQIKEQRVGSNNEIDKDGIKADDTVNKGSDKGVVSSIGKMESGDVRSRKKRKAIIMEGLDDLSDNKFLVGSDKNIMSGDRKKKDRRRVKKVSKVPRRMDESGTRDVNPGSSVANKECHREGEDNTGVFMFRGSSRAESDNKSRHISMKLVKEIGELIGVSWIISLNIRGIGEDGKIGWISSIIREERLEILGLQETKSGIVDDRWVEELWGGRGCAFTQLPANGNSGGILLIWDTNVFVCKEAMGDERSIFFLTRIEQLHTHHILNIEEVASSSENANHEEGASSSSMISSSSSRSLNILAVRQTFRCLTILYATCRIVSKVIQTSRNVGDQMGVVKMYNIRIFLYTWTPRVRKKFYDSHVRAF
ncbi:transposon TX1 [Tanacetum coccineum]